MPYKFATENKDYSDYGSGRVFYNAPGQPAFPVRLSSEVFQRCWALRQKMGLTTPAVIYDPCCGSAYHLSTLAYLQWQKINSIIASDINADILDVAARNLGLLTQSGLEKRVQEIAVLQDKFGKQSHADATISAQYFSHQLRRNRSSHQITTRLFTADAMNRQELVENINSAEIDIIFTDVPYGLRSDWQSTRKTNPIDADFLWHMLDTLSAISTEKTIVAVCANKAQKCEHQSYKRVGRFQIGKRRITLLQQKY